ncbi:hypothetical protein BXO88_15310 [Oribacterium sp. C9]|uniref:CAP domain-containing protein n=1 Tax=Oribacterium sp. C9 TaxID=1943579 RepID=UPI00098F7E31|nr:CAP domain-containing protein [Oribacterium sp. C9]OON84850.1 hypothetical protein BXO88_15310 [Oribacterium sp. C9]
MKKLALTLLSLCCFMSFSASAGWQATDAGWRYLNESGQPVYGNWVNDNQSWYYIDSNGIMSTGWIKIGDSWYHMSESGAMQCNAWINSGNNWYYLGPDGRMITNKEVKLSGKRYCFDENGIMLHDTYSPEGLYIGSDGAVIADEAEDVDTYDSYNDSDTSDSYTYYNYGYSYGTSGSSVNNRSSASDVREFQEEVFKLVNEARKKNGSSKLSLSDELCELANIRAEELTESFSHSRPDGSSCFTVMDGSSYDDGYKGENIACGQRTPDSVMTSWLNSSGHRKNILNRNYSEIGVGFYEDASGYRYWVQLFAG